MKIHSYVWKLGMLLIAAFVIIMDDPPELPAADLEPEARR